MLKTYYLSKKEANNFLQEVYYFAKKSKFRENGRTKNLTIHGGIYVKESNAHDGSYQSYDDNSIHLYN
jgi:hypothetical protein